MSSLFLPTERQPPADAEALSHKLMVRAGLIRQLGSGLWSWLPAGWRVHKNVVQIVREEINGIGGQEMLMPVLQPAELWRRSGRYESVGGELMRLKDRKDADMVLAMTHEEAVTFHAAQSIRSYRDLPLILYHFQIKERDEPRPRAGVLRTREFIMKDSYSFDTDMAGLEEAYERHRLAYHRIFERCGLEFYESDSDVGMMGGTGAHEFMAPCAAGENDVVLGPNGYSANIEVAVADAQPGAELPDSVSGRLHTPGATTVDQVTGVLGIQPSNLIKAFPVIPDGGELTMVFVRGDHKVNEIKLQNVLGTTFRPAKEDELRGPAGFLGPVEGVRTLWDVAITAGKYVAGANEVDHHAVVDVPAGDRHDVREVLAGDTIDGVAVTIEPAIEIGNIFKLGTRYSEPLGCTYLDASGSEQAVVMGSYGIGPARVAAAAVEQFSDDNGLSWPRSIAPFDVEVVSLGKPDSAELAAAEQLYEELKAAGFDALLDDRSSGAGEKFADAELLGVPLRLTIGRKSLEVGNAEAQARRGQAELAAVPLEGAAEAVRELWESLP
ncbi:MAG TPA: proline--tRNA ligase [Baekduia sp.]|nr:proline--tRNA ligase [Baekduia sp.]